MKTLILILLSFTLSGQSDKSDVKHVYASLGLTVIGSEISYHYTKNVTKSLLMGSATALTIGLGKEFIYDRTLKKGTFSKMDIFFDVWGVLLGVVIERCWLNMRGKETVYKDPFKD